MKLCRYGQPGQEKPGIVDADGAIRDVSGLIDDFTVDTLATAPERSRSTPSASTRPGFSAPAGP